MVSHWERQFQLRDGTDKEGRRGGEEDSIIGDDYVVLTNRENELNVGEEMGSHSNDLGGDVCSDDEKLRTQAVGNQNEDGGRLVDLFKGGEGEKVSGDENSRKGSGNAERKEKEEWIGLSRT
ncbi:hypothetical protein LguiA_001844 [Lonicera macranthoides]